MRTPVLRSLALVLFSSLLTAIVAMAETEPNDTKATANPLVLPSVSTLAVMTGNSVLGSGVGLDYFRVTTATQTTAGFYRHRLITTTTGTAGHTASIRGLSQSNGVIGTGDNTAQTSGTATTPPRFVQWYTTQAGGDLYVRIAGVAATTSDYSLDYEVAPVTEIAGPATLPSGSIAISTTPTTVDTDMWVYDGTRTAIPLAGQDDEFGTTSAGGNFTRTYAAGTYYLAITDFNMANNQASPTTAGGLEDFDDGTVLDFPGVITNSTTAAAGLALNPTIGGTLVPATKTGPFEVVFVSFTAVVPVELLDVSVD